MIQNINPYKLDNSYKNLSPSNDSFMIMTRDMEILFKCNEDTLSFPRYSEICELSESIKLDIRYLFSINGPENTTETYFLVFETKYTAEDDVLRRDPYSKLIRKLKKNGYGFHNRINLRRVKPKHQAYAGSIAYQLGSWYSDNRICGRCGYPLKHDKVERMMKCDKCGNMIFPKICPGVIAAVIDGDRILLTKYNIDSNFALVAGFTESGETIEETVHREVMEETGLKVKNLRYYKSQPWTFTDTLLFGFFCEPDDGLEITRDTNELAYANWVSRSKLDFFNDEGTSLTCEMIRLFKEGNVK